MQRRSRRECLAMSCTGPSLTAAVRCDWMGIEILQLERIAGEMTSRVRVCVKQQGGVC